MAGPRAQPEESYTLDKHAIARGIHARLECRMKQVRRGEAQGAKHGGQFLPGEGPSTITPPCVADAARVTGRTCAAQTAGLQSGGREWGNEDGGAAQGRSTSTSAHLSVRYKCAISGTSGSSGFASVSSDEMDNNTLEMVSAGLHWSFKMSKQIPPLQQRDMDAVSRAVSGGASREKKKCRLAAPRGKK